MGKYKLVDNQERKRFEFDIEGMTPLIDYIKNKTGSIYLTHTEVPYPLQNRGIGHELVKQALKDCERQGLTVVPTCSFVAAYIIRHPKWKRILMPGINLDR